MIICFLELQLNHIFRRRGRPYITERKSYTKHPDKSIHNRDSVVDERGRFGDYEGDTIYGSVGKGYLVTAIDRKSRYLVAATCKDKSILSINEAFREAFEKASLKIKPLTLTLDNGSEFNGYADIEKDLDLEIYLQMFMHLGKEVQMKISMVY